jgi:hypothetical protein
MFAKVIFLLRKLIIQIKNLDKSDGSKDESTFTAHPVIKIKQKNFPNPKQSVTKKVINKEALAKKIKRNMFFLDELIIKLEDKPQYILYYEKVVELKTQSEATYKILHRLTIEKPYYQKTIEMILRHTNIVSELLEE